MFYGLWDWRFLGLLLASSLVDFIAAKAIQNSKTKNNKKIFLWLSVCWNLGILFLFKYFGFFIESFEGLFAIENTSAYHFFDIAIPLGLSFYTFQTMSYTIDVYRNKIKPTPHLLEFLCFVSFFPQLVAGPIERAKHLLPQFEKNRVFDWQNSIVGLRQILWGLFKKIIVAEKLGVAVTMVFSNPEGYHWVTIVYALVLFCFQVYCDFSGYTDIAIGTARLFGFKLSRNFHLPYLAKSISEFWQRWHITLTRWFTDYIFVPLAKTGKQIGVLQRSLALLLTFTLVGLWHGANWTFILFGLFNGFILILERLPLFKKNKTPRQLLQKAPWYISVCYTFLFCTFSALLFRAENMAQVSLILKQIFTGANGALNSLIGVKLGYLLVMLLAEVFTRTWDFPLEKIESKIPKLVRWGMYYTLIIIIIRYAEPKEAFIYFQF